jgi:hypothetical protein
MQCFLSKTLAMMLVLFLAAATGAQEREEGDRDRGDRNEREERGERGGRGRFGGPGGRGGFEVSRLMLVRVEPVQEELGLVEEQLTKVNDLRDELRGGRGGRGDRGDRPNFREMSEEERQEFMAQRQKEAAERSAHEKEKLGEILMPHQSERLEEIFLQVRGASALVDPAVAEQVGLTDDDQEELREAIQTAREGMQDEMRALFESGDREQIGEKMREMQQKVDEQALATLSDEQKQKFTEMKGEKFDLPPDALRGAFGGGRGGRGGREGRPERPQRPSTDEV